MPYIMICNLRQKFLLKSTDLLLDFFRVICLDNWPWKNTNLKILYSKRQNSASLKLNAHIINKKCWIESRIWNRTKPVLVLSSGATTFTKHSYNRGRGILEKFHKSQMLNTINLKEAANKKPFMFIKNEEKYFHVYYISI